MANRKRELEKLYRQMLDNIKPRIRNVDKKLHWCIVVIIIELHASPVAPRLLKLVTNLLHGAESFLRT